MATVAPKTQQMTEGSFDLMPGEEQKMKFESFDTAGGLVSGLVTDRRLILRASEGLCSFPLNFCCTWLFKADTDSSYAIVDLKNVQPYVAHGCLANCLTSMFDLRVKQPFFCCCLPTLLPNGVRLGFSRPAGDYVPFWSFWPLWSTGHGNSFQSLTLQLHKNDALELRKLLAIHPQAKGLGYTGGAQGSQKGGGQAWS